MTFEEIKRRATAAWEKLLQDTTLRIYVSTSACCLAEGTGGIVGRIREEFAGKDVLVREVGCLGLCHLQPLVILAGRKHPTLCYGNVTEDTLPRLVGDYLAERAEARELALGSLGKGGIAGVFPLDELPTLRAQKRIALRNCGLIDPLNINQYLAAGGYGGLARALTLTPGEVREEIAASGLRRSGSFFSAEERRTFAEAAGEKYVICNAAGGVAGTCLERVLLAGDPHAVLEGLLISAYAVDARRGLIYINEEYGSALTHIRQAICSMEELGLLGKDILGSDFSFELEVRAGPGSLTLAEDKALLAALAGERADPVTTYLSTGGLSFEGQAALVTRVEELTKVSAILGGWERYGDRAISPQQGTKVMLLAGDVVRPGLYEVPSGTTLGHIVRELGGGTQNGRGLKALQLGGLFGPWFSPDQLEAPLDYENLFSNPVLTGSLVVADERSCLVELVRNALSVMEAENCGKCVLGREGTRQLTEILTDICAGRGRAGDLDLLIELAEAMAAASSCSLGRAAANPVLTTLRGFRGEYESHIKEKRCPAGVCFPQ